MSVSGDGRLHVRNLATARCRGRFEPSSPNATCGTAIRHQAEEHRPRHPGRPACELCNLAQDRESHWAGVEPGDSYIAAARFPAFDQARRAHRTSPPLRRAHGIELCEPLATSIEARMPTLRRSRAPAAAEIRSCHVVVERLMRTATAVLSAPPVRSGLPGGRCLGSAPNHSKLGTTISMRRVLKLGTSP